MFAGPGAVLPQLERGAVEVLRLGQGVVEVLGLEQEAVGVLGLERGAVEVLGLVQEAVGVLGLADAQRGFPGHIVGPVAGPARLGLVVVASLLIYQLPTPYVQSSGILHTWRNGHRLLPAHRDYHVVFYNCVPKYWEDDIAIAIYEMVISFNHLTIQLRINLLDKIAHFLKDVCKGLSCIPRSTLEKDNSRSMCRTVIMVL